MSKGRIDAVLFIVRGETRSEKVQALQEILETSEALRKCITYFSIHLSGTATDLDDGDVGWKLQDENLPSIINMWTEIRELDIRCGNPNAFEWGRLSDRVKTALWNTRFTSPHLSVLSLHGISISPYDLAFAWKSIKVITLGDVKMNTGEGTSKNASIFEYRLEKVKISGGKFPLHQNSQILGGLRQFWADSFRICPYSIRQTWNVIHIASKSLEDLSLTTCFGE